jgi:hypothetical protein
MLEPHEFAEKRAKAKVMLSETTHKKDMPRAMEVCLVVLEEIGPWQSRY